MAKDRDIGINIGLAVLGGLLRRHQQQQQQDLFAGDLQRIQDYNAAMRAWKADPTGWHGDILEEKERPGGGHMPIGQQPRLQLQSQFGQGAQFQRMMGNMFQPQEPFTLPPGGRRYGGGGQLIAEAPAAPSAYSVQGLMAQGLDRETAQLAQAIHLGLKPRASTVKQYEDMDEVSKVKYLASLESVAAGQYFGIEGGNQQPQMPKLWDWIQAEKAKLKMLRGTPQGQRQQFRLRGTSQESTGPSLPGAQGPTMPRQPAPPGRGLPGTPGAILPPKKVNPRLNTPELDKRIEAEVLQKATRPRWDIYKEVGKLKPIWDQLSDEERISAYRKIAIEGWNGDEILRLFTEAIRKPSTQKSMVAPTSNLVQGLLGQILPQQRMIGPMRPMFPGIG